MITSYDPRAKSNLCATAAPTANDDVDDEYSVGSRWIDIAHDQEYVCLDASAGAAVWSVTTFGASGQVHWSKGADVASANALVLGTDGNSFDITGTTAILSIGTLGVGTLVILHFDDALTLTHHATDLILPGGANITTAAGDEAFFLEYATGDWQCAAYTKADGSAVSVNEYDTIYIDAGAMVPCTTNPALQGTHEYGTNDIDMDHYAFDAGATKERVQFKNTMPDNWDRGTIRAKFYWSSATGSTAGDTVEWGIKAGAVSDSDVIDAALGTPQVISDALLANNGTDLQISGATPAITVGGTPALGDVTVFEIYRNTDGSDDMAEDAWLMGALLQYKKVANATAW